MIRTPSLTRPAGDPGVRVEGGRAPACIGDFEVTPREGGHAHDLPFLPIPIDPKRVAAETPVRALNRDLLQLRRRAGGGGSHATRRTDPPIRETVCGREQGDDHMTRACDAIERESGERRGRFRARVRAREGRRAEDARRRPRGVLPFRFRPNNAGDAPRELPQPTLRPPGGAGRPSGP